MKLCSHWRWLCCPLVRTIQLLFQIMNISLQAFERADTENEFVTSEIDTYYHQTTKEIANNSLLPHTPQQTTTLYELLEYAKTRSILKSSNNNMHPSASRSNLSSSSGSKRNSLVIKPTNLVQFNQNHTLAAELNPSIKSKKIPIRISSLKRETKTAQTLRWVWLLFLFFRLLLLWAFFELTIFHLEQSSL